MTDYIIIPEKTTGTQIVTEASTVKALDNTVRLMEVICPTSRRVCVSRDIVNPYRVVTPAVAENNLLASLQDDDAKLINCSGYSELCVSGFSDVSPNSSPGFELMVIGYLRKDSTTWNPVTCIDKYTMGFTLSQNNSGEALLPISLDGTTWYGDMSIWSAKVAFFERVSIHIKSLAATNITKLAICYSMA